MLKNVLLFKYGFSECRLTELTRMIKLHVLHLKIEHSKNKRHVFIIPFLSDKLNLKAKYDRN